jgi:hypothetical protein
VRNDREAGSATAVVLGTRLAEFTSRDSLLPHCSRRLEVVVIAVRVSNFGLEILQLRLSVVLEKPVESLLVISTAEKVEEECQ